MQVLGCLLMSLIAGFFIVLGLGFSLLRSILRLFGINVPRMTVRSNQPEPEENAEQRKVFSDDEGEYIDFEDISE